jgi:hypothetical protein
LRQAYDYWQDQPGNYFPIKAPLSMKRDRPFNPYLLCDVNRISTEGSFRQKVK